jgi:hypothetical protein
MTLKQPHFFCIPEDLESSVDDNGINVRDGIDERDETLYSYPISVRIPRKREKTGSIQGKSAKEDPTLAKIEVDKDVDREVDKEVEVGKNANKEVEVGKNANKEVEANLDLDKNKPDKINILLVLPAIGDDNFNQKLSFLSNNIRVILSTAPSNAEFEMFVTCYKLTNVEMPITILLGDPPIKTLAVHEVNPVHLIRRTILDAISDLPNKNVLNPENIKIKQTKGYLGQFLFNFVKPINYDKIDFVYLFLDDIRLTENFKFDLLYEVYLLSGLDIVSPSLTHDSVYSYEYMLQGYGLTLGQGPVNLVRQTSILEFYAYFMNFKAYQRYYDTFLTKETKWMWGIDLSFTNAGFKVGIYDYLTMQHYYQTTNHKEVYGRKVPNPLEEKKHLNNRFVFSDYSLIKIIKMHL